MFFESVRRAHAIARRATHSVLTTACLLVAGAALAAPAPWYWWVSKADGRRICAQHMPSQGWDKAEGPFAQAGCQVQRPRPLLGR